MTTVGLNNNTGTTLSNSNNNFDKINKKITSAGNTAKKINDTMGALKGWQNAGNAQEKIKSAAEIAAMFM